MKRLIIAKIIIDMVKKCFFCGSPNMVKNGLRCHAQMYKCKDFGKQFVGRNRRDKHQVITDYVEGKQTLNQLADKYGVSSKTIRQDLEGMRYVQKISKDKEVAIQMDTTYWGRNFGLMVIKDVFLILDKFEDT